MLVLGLFQELHLCSKQKTAESSEKKKEGGKKEGRIIFDCAMGWFQNVEKKGKRLDRHDSVMKQWLLHGDNLALCKEVISLPHYSPLHIEMAVVSHHGKGWAVFLPANALLADRDHGAVETEMEGGEAGKGVTWGNTISGYKQKN